MIHNYWNSSSKRFKYSSCPTILLDDSGWVCQCFNHRCLQDVGSTGRDGSSSSPMVPW